MTDISVTAEVTRFVLQGLVQGQGVRPRIARFAAAHEITGTVRNSGRGVEILAVGELDSMAAFENALTSSFMGSSLIAETVQAWADPIPKDFRIVESLTRGGVYTSVPLDIAVCSDCLCDVRTPENRRFGYPFTTCTRCGPRYSLLRRMPFDRDWTSMAAFPMCNACQAEYRDPSDRRFHAQTIACHECGPTCWASDLDGGCLARQEDAVHVVGEQIAAGKIAAVKGIGGYQLICDATNEAAVRRLRDRKRRPGKPLPVMVRDVSAAEQLANLCQFERDALASPVNAIVLLRAGESVKASSAVSPNLNKIGIMLPTSPLHAMLLDAVGKPLVVTSGNVHGSPLIYKNATATVELAGIADVFLHHDREITHPVDDSVVHCYGDKVSTIRAARGIAPMTIPLPRNGPAIAVGGHQKVALAISNNRSFVLAPHIGDMETESSRIRFHDGVKRLQTLYQSDADHIACDQHPNYFTSSIAGRLGSSKIHVQHHHAHIAAAMLDHGLIDQSVLGIAFDGTGYGDDGTIWGGEALLATDANFERVGHLRPFRLPGGEHAIKHPKRILQSLLSQLDHTLAVEPHLEYAIKHGPVTSSMGRLFDGIAALLLDLVTVEYEGEAAMRLEAHCETTELGSYVFRVTNNSPLQFDWRPVLAEMHADLGRLSSTRVAMKFHRAVAFLVIDVASRYDGFPCVVTGGVFQNRILLELVQSMAIERKIDIRLPGRIPVNDGGLAIGQLVVASANRRRSDGDAVCV
ncbi:carbamoyltransferase HypF [Rubripirellula reticaptiva]|uniref:Carbamoyltransferase n=1 Tax=Rubripirellula reticaptiva TaxID=2528013 RepID=A0A5C6EE28_9BACT|nr:carbamoyltransferase HypF [Rubripirellula reticaptiva]TWU46704.1 Carbamoyltransferase HypF [Rubripirellula reticaptiva]